MDDKYNRVPDVLIIGNYAEENFINAMYTFVKFFINYLEHYFQLLDGIHNNSHNLHKQDSFFYHSTSNLCIPVLLDSEIHDVMLMMT
jgi:hypothetical protein